MSNLLRSLPVPLVSESKLQLNNRSKSVRLKSNKDKAAAHKFRNMMAAMDKLGVFQFLNSMLILSRIMVSKKKS